MKGHVEIQYLAPGQTVTQNESTSSNTFSIGKIYWLEASYPINGAAIVRVIDPDMNLRSGSADNFIIKIWSDTDIRGTDITVTETGKGTGVFEGSVFFTTAYTSSGQILKVKNGDMIIAQYVDSTLPDPYLITDELEITSSTLSGTVSPFFRSYPPSNLRTIDMFGNSLDTVSVDQQVSISADLANGKDAEQPFTYFVQIQDGNGVTVHLAWLEGSLSSGQSFSPSVSWIPKEAGTYTATAFHWISIDNPTAISPPVSTTINVTGELEPFDLKNIELSDVHVKISHKNKVSGGTIDINDMNKFYGFSIGGKIENKNHLSTNLTYVAIVKDENQNPILLRYKIQTINGDRSSSLGVNWTPSSPGTYYIDTFVWNNPQDQEIIHDPVSIKIQLVDETNSYKHVAPDFNSTYELIHQNQSYNIQFKNMGAHLSEITKDESIPSLTLTLEKAGGGRLNIAIPKNLLDAKIIDGNDFVVKIDGLLVPYNETFEETQRILDININRGNEKIEITPAYLADGQ